MSKGERVGRDEMRGNDSTVERGPTVRWTRLLQAMDGIGTM